MKTLTLDAPGRFSTGDSRRPGTPGSDEALVRVRHVGICGTDLHAFEGVQPFFSYPRILGHELGVEVEAVGEGVTNVVPGSVCSVEPYLNCGTCPACRRGKTNCCRDLEVLGVHVDGGMRERIIVPAAKLHPSRELSTDALALVEMLSIGAHAVRRAGLESGDVVLVVGAGPIGLGVMQFALLEGAHVLAADLRSARLRFAREHVGIHSTVDARVGSLRELLDGELPHVVFDATGSAASMAASFDLVEHGGRLVFVGLVQDDVTFRDPDFHRKELTLLSSRNATGSDFRSVIAALEEGQVDVDAWITHRAALQETAAAFPVWLEPETDVVKAMVSI